MRARQSGGEGTELPGGEPGSRRSLPPRSSGTSAERDLRKKAGPLELPRMTPVVLPSVVELRRVPAGPELAAVVASLRSDDAAFETWATGPGASPNSVMARADARLTLLEAAARVASWAAGVEAELTWAAHQEIASEARGLTLKGGDAAATAEIAAALHRTQGTVSTATNEAYQLSLLPGLSWLLGEGHLSWAHARAVISESLDLPDPLLPALESVVLKAAPEQTPSELRRTTRRQVLRLDPRTAGERHAAVARHRTVTLIPLYDGMSEVRALLTAPEALTVVTGLDRMVKGLNAQERARRGGDAAGARDDAEPRDERAGAKGEERADSSEGQTEGGFRRASRADALVALASALLADSATAEENLPTTVAGIVTAAGTAPVAVRVQITAAALAGLSEEPAELEGYGPIPAWLGQLLASGATDWQVAVTNGAGVLLDVHPLVYGPTDKQRAYVTAKAVTCGMVNCSRPAGKCDIDHVVPFNHSDPEEGGKTEVANLCPLCRLHHNLKTWWNWHTAYTEDGTLITITPLGRVYFTPPPVQPCAP